MFTDVQIVNLGLSKIASSRISRLDPPVSSLERFIDQGYTHWKRTELAKRRWVFAIEKGYVLTAVAELPDTDKPHKYSLPTDCLRPIRQKRTEWQQYGRNVHSAYPNLAIDYVRNVPEAEFDALFVEVLACRIALESAEYVTQSNTKKADAEALYRQAVAEAGQVNAFIRGPEDIGSDDDDFSFVTSRYV